MEVHNDSEIDLPISAQAMAVLSKAAKHHVQRQQIQILQQDKSIFKRQLKSSGDHQRKSFFATARSHTQSAPPVVHPLINSFAYSFRGPSRFRPPPKISVFKANQDGEHAYMNEELLQGYEAAVSEVNHDVGVDFNPYEDRKDVRELDDSKQISPEGKQKHYLDTPRSVTTGSDWAWVRERLASRESGATRPDSSMTFADFLDCLNLDSDEYDTDLEEEFNDYDTNDDDPTGIWHYRRMCHIRGITPAQQVIRKLSKESVNFQLNHRCLSVTDTQALTNGLGHNAFVKSLNLSGNSIDDASARHISNMLRKNTSIKKVDLSNNYLGYNAGLYLGDTLRTSSSLTHLCVSNNKLRDQEALLLCEALRNNVTLMALDVSRNSFFDETGEAFAAALMDNRALTSLNLSWNCMGKLAAAAIGKAIKVNKTLRSLDLSWNGVGDDGAALLARPLRTNSTLKLLNLAVNHIGPFGAERLAACVCGGRVGKRVKKSSSGLHTLILDRNPLGRKGLAMFVKHLETSQKLVDLSIKEVVLTAELLSSVRALLKSRRISIFFEGQTQDEKQECAMQSVVAMLQRVCIKNRVQVSTYLSSLSPTGALPPSTMLTAMREFKHVSELEADRCAAMLSVRAGAPISSDEIIKRLAPPAARRTAPVKKLKRKSTVVKFSS